MLFKIILIFMIDWGINRSMTKLKYWLVELVFVHTLCVKLAPETNTTKIISTRYCLFVFGDIIKQNTLCCSIQTHCSFCEKHFVSVTTLRRHMRTVHLESCYTCNLCGKYYNRTDNLLRHCRSAHEHYTSKHLTL